MISGRKLSGTGIAPIPKTSYFISPFYRKGVPGQFPPKSHSYWDGDQLSPPPSLGPGVSKLPMALPTMKFSNLT